MGNEQGNDIGGDENWTKVADNTVRRRLQNRLAQRRYRQNHRARSRVEQQDMDIRSPKAAQRNPSYDFGSTKTNWSGQSSKGADKQVNHHLRSNRVATNDGEDGRIDGEEPRETITVLNVHGGHNGRLANEVIGTQQTLEPSNVNQLSGNSACVDQPEDNHQTLLLQTSMDGSPSFSMSSVDYILQPGDLPSNFHGEMPSFWDEVDMHVNTTPLLLPLEPGALPRSSNPQTSDKTPPPPSKPHCNGSCNGLCSSADTKESQRVTFVRPQTHEINEPREKPHAPSKPTTVGLTPLHLATKQGHKNIVECLLRAGCDINAKDTAGQTALHVVAEAGDARILRVLLEGKADSSMKDYNGRTPFHLAAETGQVATVRLLLGRLSDIDTADSRGYTPLHAAAVNGHVEVVNLIASGGGNINAKTV